MRPALPKAIGNHAGMNGLAGSLSGHCRPALAASRGHAGYTVASYQAAVLRFRRLKSHRCIRLAGGYCRVGVGDTTVVAVGLGVLVGAAVGSCKAGVKVAVGTSVGTGEGVSVGSTAGPGASPGVS